MTIPIYEASWAFRENLQKTFDYSKGASSWRNLILNYLYLITHPRTMCRFAFFGMDVQIRWMLNEEPKGDQE